jgi:hypothetical protein
MKSANTKKPKNDTEYLVMGIAVADRAIEQQLIEIRKVGAIRNQLCE